MGPGPSSRNLMAGGLGHAAHTGPHLNRHTPHIRTTTISPTHAKPGWNERSLPSVMTVLDIAHRAKSRYLSRSQGSVTLSTHLTHRNVLDRPRPRPWQWLLSCRLVWGSAAHGGPQKPETQGQRQGPSQGCRGERLWLEAHEPFFTRHHGIDQEGPCQGRKGRGRISPTGQGVELHSHPSKLRRPLQ